MSVLEELKRGIMRLFESVIERRIVEVESWDGSASRWEGNTQAYCEDCLINSNPQAGRNDPSEWIQENCKLPVRGPEDRQVDFVKQAVFAAAGGRGITRLSRPSDVSADDWDTLLRDAARQLVDIYLEMDDVAPFSVYEIAGMSPPEERAIDNATLHVKVYEKFMELYPTWSMHNLFQSSQGMYIISTVDDRIFQIPVTLDDNDEIVFGSPVQVKMDFTPIAPPQESERALNADRYHITLVNMFKEDYPEYIMGNYYHNMDGTYIIATYNDKLYRFDVTMDADDNIIIGEPVEVKKEFEPVGEMRAVGINMLYSDLYEQVEELYGEEAYIHDIFMDANETYVVVSIEGRLIKLPIVIGEDDSVMLGEPMQVKMEFTPDSGMRSLVVTRQDDGRYRWVAVACTAILNRVGEIDSTKLFDNFVKRLDDGNYPELDFFHINGTDMGKADFVARDGFALICSGLFDDDEIGRAAAEGIATDEPGYWGISIKYQPLDGEMIDVQGVQIPVYTDGILRKVSILPERQAAALFTTIDGGNSMDKKMRDVLGRLLKSDKLVEEMEERVDGINERAVSDGLIARQESKSKKPEQETGNADEQPKQVKVIGDYVETEAQMVAMIRGRVTELENTNTEMAEALQRAADVIGELVQRVERLEVAEDERKRAYLSDLPAKRSVPKMPVFRPREQAKEDDSNAISASAQASAILAAKLGNGGLK